MESQPIELRDQLSIDTPELVSIDISVAGLGSRCAAVLIDYLLQGVTIVVGLLFFSLLVTQDFRSSPNLDMGSRRAYKWGVAIGIAIPFLLHWGYFALFEAFWNGQTPGKRLMKLRVIQQNGRALGLFESMGRNLIRFVDMLPFFYFTGALCVFITRRQQRLGDMVAGTLVVHASPVDAPFVPSGGRTITAPSFERLVEEAAPPKASLLQADAVSRLDQEDLLMIENFLDRRLDLPMDVRARLAKRLSLRMTAKMERDMPAAMSDETFLEALAAGLREHGSMR